MNSGGTAHPGFFPVKNAWMEKTMKRSVKALSVLSAVVLVFLAGCTFGTEQPVPPSLEPVSPTHTPTPPPTAPVLPTQPAPNVTCSELSFFLDPALGSGVDCTTMPESSSSDIPMDIFIYPAHTGLTIQNYPLTGTQFDPVILVYPVFRFNELLPDVVPQRVADLEMLIAGGESGSPDLPFLPPLPMIQTFISQNAILPFNGGQGVRFITDYHEAPHPITNRTVFYTFQGLTNDGARWVSVTLPISSPELPANDDGIDWFSENWLQNYNSYAGEVKDALDELPPGSFSPSIDQLDELVQSITISPSGNTEAVPESTLLLPHALYFLAGAQSEAQVWRLRPDGENRLQVTNAEKAVNAFAVSPVDGGIAFVSDNRLFLMSHDGETTALIADGHTVDLNVEDYVFRSQVSSPVFSPDGRILAYGFNGLHLYDLATGEDAHVLTNLGNLLGEPFVFTREAYFPGPWSPDGAELLVIMGYYEGSTLAVMEPDAEPLFRRLWSEGPVCCLFSWTADGESVLVANPYYTVDLPGLWRFDAETGEQIIVVPGLEEDGSFHFVGWPLALETGEWFYFHVNLPQFSPDTGIPLTLARSGPDGLDPESVRPETFRVIEALWVADGSVAVILQRSESGEMQVVLVPTDGSPLRILLEGPGLRRLMWGP